MYIIFKHKSLLLLYEWVWSLGFAWIKLKLMFTCILLDWLHHAPLDRRPLLRGKHINCVQYWVFSFLCFCFLYSFNESLILSQSCLKDCNQRDRYIYF